ncbi:aminoglycoside phosphotransferase family protein [Mycolicibacterium sp. YH-1]|uniref:aminoglycoside phosphotransferase family protein n=1 Tax=Mycolicibacterium sp. YH-1 TaxID=2908837 RepID=UPI001F4BDCD1|nr:aminoglycoside phosphotransferase family protein [Mycolicibacterium sp. YH-1]UNB55710.1 aminoglycoside phosphotransferase family protein [Mycolicibacterium sp. YH-1]
MIDLPRLVSDTLEAWDLVVDGPVAHGHGSVTVPVHTSDRVPAVLKIALPATTPALEHLALRRWGGNGAVLLMRADPHRRAVLLERLHNRNLDDLWDIEACEVVASLYGRLHVPAMPQLPDLADMVASWTEDLSALPRSAPIPRRLVEQAIAHGRDFSSDGATSATLVHGDLHYANVLAADREPWLSISPSPINGDPHFEVAPMLWNRWDDLAGDTRGGIRRRFFAVVDAAGLDDERARDWVVVRAVREAMVGLTAVEPDPALVTRCVAIAKAVQG